MNTFKVAPADVIKRVASLKKKYHPNLIAARVRVEVFTVKTDGEDGSPLRYKGAPTSVKTEIVKQLDRVSCKYDARIIIDEVDWTNTTAAQKDALLDRALYFIKVKQKEEKTQLDGNDRPKLELREPDRVFAWFDKIAERHGSNSLEVQEAQQVAANAQFYLPGFDVIAPKPTKAEKIVPMPKAPKSQTAEPQAAAAAK